MKSPGRSSIFPCVTISNLTKNFPTVTALDNISLSIAGGEFFGLFDPNGAAKSTMPSYIQAFSKVTLVFWSMDGFLQVLWRRSSTIDILPNVGVLLAMAVLITTVNVWRFKKGHVF